LCGGPLHVEANDLVCRRGHELDAVAFRESAAARASVALWLAIDALESQAEGLRFVARSQGDHADLMLAEQAESDARLLRELTPVSARRHGFDDESGEDGQ
jgi:hypothetical protein